MFFGFSSGSWVPMSLSGCVFWLRADMGITKDGSNRVSAWADQSGTGDANKHATQAVAGNQPLWNASDANANGRPSITFAKARPDQMSTGTWSTAMPNPATWVVVGRLTSRDTLLAAFIDGANVGTRQAMNSLAADQKLQIFAGAGPLQGGVLALATPFVNVGVYSTSGKVYSSARTAAGTGTTGTSTQTLLRIGNSYASGGTAGWALDGEIYEIIGYNRALSQAEVETVLTQLGARYGITIGA